MKKITALAIVILFTLNKIYAQVPGSAIDVQHYRFALELNDANNIIKGKTTITLKALHPATDFNIDLVSKGAEKGMLVSGVSSSGKPVKFSQQGEELKISDKLSTGTVHNYTISYSGVPADGLIISTNRYGHRTFFGDNWPNRAHNWLPCVDNIADKASVEFVVTAPSHYQVVANGLKIEDKALPNNMHLTHWSESAPISTKIMVIGVAKFAVSHSGDVKGIPVYSYVFPEDSITGFKNYSVAPQILNYYIDKIGPFAYKKLANVQSKTIFGGMENAGCIFYYEGSVEGREIEELMAHEIAHQWFGDAASEKSFANLWLSEGFATFMTNVYLESKYGTDTLRKRLKADRELILQFEKKRMTPVVDTGVHSNYMQLLNANSYQKGGWILQMLRQKLGEEKFWAGIREYFAKYDGGNANTADLETILEKVSGQDLHQYFKQWVYTAGVPLIKIDCLYYPADKQVQLMIDQRQKALFQLHLKVLVDGKPIEADLSQARTVIPLSVTQKPATIIVDPDTELLARYVINIYTITEQ